MGIKNFIERVTGLAEVKKAKAEAERLKVEAREIADEAKKIAEQARMTPKERATANQEPWVAVLDTKVNPENIRNGFFELDWNEYFVLQLKQAGYGFDGDPEEEIVDRWFRDIVGQMLAEEGMDTTRAAGYINVVPIAKGKSQVS
jgi:hypothetical protein